LSFARAFKWSFLGETATRTISPLVLVILARLLAPEDFGVIAAAVMVISFSQVFWDAGMSKALIQFQGNREAAANVAFWTNMVLALVVAGSLVLASQVIAERVFHDPRVALVLQVLAVQVLLSAACSVQAALLQKDMQYKALFWVRLATTAMPALLSVPVALVGGGYWALVAGTLLGQFVQLLMLWRMTTWRPGFTFDEAVMRRLAKFSSWVIVSGLSGWFYLWADSFIVGMHLGAHDLGLYRSGNALVMALTSMLIGPLLPVLYSHLSDFKGDRREVREVLVRVMRAITVISIPFGFALCLLAEPVTRLIFGPAWDGVGTVVAIMALTHGFAWTVGANGEAYRAIGRPDYETKIMAGALPVYCIAYWIGAQHGLLIFLWTRLAATVFGIAVQLWVAKLAFDIPVLRTLAHFAQISAMGAPALLLGYYGRGLGADALVEQAALLTLAVAWIAGCFWFLERNGLVRQGLDMVRRGRRP
jgi:O-antigen/teichoic acid export membrane protein